MGSLMDILLGPDGMGTQLGSLLNMLMGLDNLGANLFGSLSDTFGGISGSLDTISFLPEAIPPA
ncbi:hypothetical protein [Rhodococcus sp. 24CO]|uniref:hypothetical protein n=1 Tax=Rhodococcus sp. 24CO TaxID=3117460 RepID=UPI003D347621